MSLAVAALGDTNEPSARTVSPTAPFMVLSDRVWPTTAGCTHATLSRRPQLCKEIRRAFCTVGFYVLKDTGTGSSFCDGAQNAELIRDQLINVLLTGLETTL